MSYYSIVLFLAILSLVARKLRCRDEVIFSSLVLIGIALIFANRDFDVGQDTESYLIIFNSPSDFDLFVEPGFLFINRVVALFGGDERALLFVFSILICGSLYQSYKLSVKREGLLCLALFACTHFFWLFNIQVIRNGIAAAEFLLAVILLLRGGKALPLGLAAIAISIHYTAVLPVVSAYLLSKIDLSERNAKSFLKIGVLSILAVSGFFLVVPWLASSFDAYYMKFASHTELTEAGEAPQSKFSFFYIVTLITILGGILRWKAFSEEIKKLFLIYVGIVVCSSAFWSVVLFRDRILYYAVVFEPLIWVALFGANRSSSKLYGLLGISLLWGSGVVFVWGPSNILTHY